MAGEAQGSAPPKCLGEEQEVVTVPQPQGGARGTGAAEGVGMQGPRPFSLYLPFFFFKEAHERA